MNTNINYSGSVKARLSIPNSNGYHFKNSGLKPLYDFIARAITGNEFLHLFPKSIGIYKRSGGQDESLLYVPIPIHSKDWGYRVESSTDSTSVLFTATATYENRKSAVDSSSTVVLKLLTGEDIALAEIVDRDGKLSSIHNAMTSGVDAVYEWKLTFRDGGES